MALQAARDVHTRRRRLMGRPSVVHVLSREQQDVPVLNGRLDGGKVRRLLGALAAIPVIGGAFLCGPTA